LRRKLKLSLAIVLTFLFISLCACADSGQTDNNSPPPIPPSQTERPPASPDVSPLPAQQPGDDNDLSAPVTLSGEIVVTLDYNKQSGSASNQFAIWVEDMEGNYINTIYATKWTAVGGYKSRPDSIAIWVAKSGVSNMPDYYVDAISGATPRSSGNQTYAWNLKDINGDLVSPGKYMVFVEGTLRWKNNVLYSGVITIGDVSDVIHADAEYTYEASDRQAALTGDSPENAMIRDVTVSFTPSPGN